MDKSCIRKGILATDDSCCSIFQKTVNSSQTQTITQDFDYGAISDIIESIKKYDGMFDAEFGDKASELRGKIAGLEALDENVSVVPLGIAIFGGNKFFCNHLCGRGQLFSKLGGDLKCSRNKPTPRWMSLKWFRYGFLIFFLTMFGNMVFHKRHMSKKYY